MGLGHAVSEKTISICSGEMQSVPKSLGTRALPGGRTEPDLGVVPALLLRPHPDNVTLSTGLREEAELNLSWGREGRFLGRQGCDLKAEPGQSWGTLTKTGSVRVPAGNKWHTSNRKRQASWIKGLFMKGVGWAEWNQGLVRFLGLARQALPASSEGRTQRCNADPRGLLTPGRMKQSAEMQGRSAEQRKDAGTWTRTCETLGLQSPNSNVQTKLHTT